MTGLLLAVLAVTTLAPAAAAQTDEPAPVTWKSLPATSLVPGQATWAFVETREGEIRRGYDALLDHTEAWMKLTPHSTDSGENPTTLYFSIVFRGRRLRTTPDRVWVRAQSNLAVRSRTLRTPTLALTSGGRTLLDVVDPPPGAAAWRNYPCEPGPTCTFDGMVAAMPVVSFFKLLEADRVHGEALGIPFGLSADQVQMLAGFAKELVPVPY